MNFEEDTVIMKVLPMMILLVCTLTYGASGKLIVKIDMDTCIDIN